MCLMVWKRTFYGNVDLSTTCQCRQLRLNPLSTQINIYCIMTNQTHALLVQRAQWTRAAVMLLQSLYFSRPPPSPLRAIIPDARPLGTFENQDTVTVRRGISKRSHEKIGDCEQSSHFRVPKALSFITRLSAKPSLWKWVLSARERKKSFWNQCLLT